MPQTTDRMAGKTVLVTGGTGGIGRATAIGLASLGAHVAIVGRDRGRAETAAADIRAWAAIHAVDTPEVDAFVADLSAQAEVRRLAGEVADAYPRLDVLVNNVGGYWASRHLTADGLELTFALNHLAAFLLTNLLLDRLRASAAARVVMVSSGAQAMGRNVLFTYELARRLERSGVTANVLHPGVVRTAFAAEDSTTAMKAMTRLVRPFMKTPAQGAATSIHLASAPDLEQVTGQYFANSRPKRSSKHSYDETAAARLWQISADPVRLDAQA